MVKSIFRNSLAAFVFFLFILMSCQIKNAETNSLTIYSASSLGDLLEGMIPLFTSEMGIKVVFDLGSSGSLARKITMGAPADIFISADKNWMDFLAKDGHIDNRSLRLIARNILVCIVPAVSQKSVMKPMDLAGLKKISIGDPEHVPAGSYAREALAYYGLWDTLNNGKRLIFAWNVLAVLSHVEQGEAEAGIVYSTEALLSPKVVTAFAFPEDSHSPVCYYAAAISGSRKVRDAETFLIFLESEKFRQALLRHGFILPANGK